MKVNFDKMRQRATNDMNSLSSAIKDIKELADWEREYHDFSSLYELFNNAALSVDLLNCLEDPDGDSYTALDIDIETIEIEE